MLAARIDVARLLIEAGNWIRRFKDKTIVVCLTGGFMESDRAVHDCLQDVLFLSTVGVRPVLVHGGGKRVDAALRDSGVSLRVVNGQPDYPPEAEAILERVLAEDLNEALAAEFEELGGRAMTLNFASTPVLAGRRDPATTEGEQQGPLNSLGVVTEVDRLVIDNLCYAGQVPVIPAMCCTEDNHKLAVSELQAATAVAGELHAEKLVILTDCDLSADWELPATFSRPAAAARAADNSISPQIRSLCQWCLQALDASVRQTHLIDASVGHGLLLEVFTDAGIGIEVRGD